METQGKGPGVHTLVLPMGNLIGIDFGVLGRQLLGVSLGFLFKDLLSSRCKV